METQTDRQINYVILNVCGTYVILQVAYFCYILYKCMDNGNLRN